MKPVADNVPPDDSSIMPIERIDVANPRLYRDDVWEPCFARLRRDVPVHFVADNEIYGSFWSVTKYLDIAQMSTIYRIAANPRHPSLSTPLRTSPMAAPPK